MFLLYVSTRKDTNSFRKTAGLRVFNLWMPRPQKKNK